MTKSLMGYCTNMYCYKLKKCITNKIIGNQFFRSMELFYIVYELTVCKYLILCMFLGIIATLTLMEGTNKIFLKLKNVSDFIFQQDIPSIP